MSVNFDFNVAASLVFDASSNVTVLPTFTVSALTVASNQQDQDTDDGEVEMEIAPNVRVRLARQMIVDVRSKGEPVKE